MPVSLDHGKELNAVVPALVVGELVVKSGLLDSARVGVCVLNQFQASVRVVQVRILVLVEEVLVQELVELTEHCGASHVVAKDNSVKVRKVRFVVMV